MGLFGLVVGGSQLSQAKSAKKNAITQKQIAENTATQAAAEIIKAAALKEANDIELAKLTPEQQAPILAARAEAERLKVEAEEKREAMRSRVRRTNGIIILSVVAIMATALTGGLALIIEVPTLAYYLLRRSASKKKHESVNKEEL